VVLGAGTALGGGVSGDGEAEPAHAQTKTVAISVRKNRSITRGSCLAQRGTRLRQC
jgi:hypothetical protein